MEPVQAVVLGIIQGVLEWLPVSSQGIASVVMTQFLGLPPETADSAAVFLHSGTALSALIYFREEFRTLILQLPDYLDQLISNQDLPDEYRLMNFVVVASVFSGFSGLISLFLKDFIFQSISSSSTVFTALIGVALLLTGILKLREKEGFRNSETLNVGDGAVAGFLQGFAFIPGISRSGVTVFGLFLRDFSSEEAFRLSFIMSVPAVLMGQVAIGLLEGFTPSLNMVIAGITAFLVGYLSIDAVIKLARRLNVAYVCFALSILIFAVIML